MDEFCDITRTNPCYDGQDANKSADVYGTAIGMVAMFHLAEWIRQTIVLTTALVNVNLMPLYYFFSINVIYGYIALIYGIITRFTGDGVACSAWGVQYERGRFLALQPICLFIYIFTSWSHIVYFKIRGVEWCHEVYLEEEEEEED